MIIRDHRTIIAIRSLWVWCRLDWALWVLSFTITLWLVLKDDNEILLSSFPVDKRRYVGLNIFLLITHKHYYIHSNRMQTEFIFFLEQMFIIQNFVRNGMFLLKLHLIQIYLLKFLSNWESSFFMHWFQEANS